MAAKTQIGPTNDFFKDAQRGLRNLAYGALALPAHLITNPVDSLGKGLAVILGATPVFGGLATGLYVVKQSMLGINGTISTRQFAFAVAKAGIAAFVAGALPPVGALINSAYAVKNIGEQLEREKAQSGGNISMEQLIGQKYQQAGQNLVDMGRAQTWRRFKQEATLDNALEAAGRAIGPLTNAQVEKIIESGHKASVRARESTVESRLESIAESPEVGERRESKVQTVAHEGPKIRQSNAQGKPAEKASSGKMAAKYSKANSKPRASTSKTIGG